MERSDVTEDQIAISQGSRGCANRSSLLVAAATALGLSLAAGSAMAQGAAAISLNLGGVTDYVARGVSQTNEGGAVQGGVDLTWKLGYAGVWGSNVDFGDTTDAEIDIYAGIKPTWMGLTFDIGAIQYLYTGAPADTDYNYYELKLGVSYSLPFATVGALAYWTPDTFGAGDVEATYYEVNATVPLPAIANLSLTGAYGRQTFDGTGDYNTWNAGLSYAPIPWLSLDVRYWDTSKHSFGKAYESRVVGGAKVTYSF